MTDKTKRIIAREGLVILGIFLVCLVVVFITADPVHNPAAFTVALVFSVIGLVLFYTLYLIIRFIIWAIRALKKKALNYF